MDTLLCPIVGIGASAGGLDALKGLFQSLPTDTGAAFVVIQHLDPKHESLTAEILRRFTTMPTAQVTTGMRVEPNRVYVIPPNAYLTLKGHTLELAKPVLRHGLRMPIDTFLTSLAEQHRERAVAIIVSGTGSDGTLGLRAIKNGGGLALAQSPDTAQYDGMPRSAIATGLVDIVCPLDEMHKHLTGYLRHAYVIQPESSTEAMPVAAADAKCMSQILALLETRLEHDFGVYKQGTLGRRIARRMGLHHIDKLADYLTFLRAHEDEAKKLFKDMLISVTSFFRDSEAFDALEQKVISPLAARKHEDESIRVWVPGCATGEEAYSIAMLILEFFDKNPKHCPVQVFASDVDEAALSVARTGLYPENIAAALSAERLQRFFSKEDHSYRVSKTLRDTVTFATQNVVSDPPFSKLDLICCRNLLIYLNADVQGKVLELFHFGLREDGCLFLGHSETINSREDLFEPLSKKWRIYRRSRTPRVVPVDIPVGSRPSAAKLLAPVRKRGTANLNEIARQHLLQEFAPAAVVVDSKCSVLHFSGTTARYLEQPTGSPTQDLLALARHELRAKLRVGLRQVVRSGQRVDIDDAHVLRDGARIHVKITLKPLAVPASRDPVFLITFEDQLAPKGRTRKTKAAARATADPSLLQQMEDELKLTREDLQSNIEELESTNEELQAANEEVTSVNEELQSMNEEFTTVNSQLKDKVEELAKSNDDLANLFSSTDIGTLFVDPELKIGRFTPAASRLMNLIASDVGRPLSDISPKIADPTLLDDAKRVLDKLAAVECELTTETGECYLRRIVPYRTGDNRIAGAVITFIDISARNRAAEALRESEAKFRALIESAPEALVIVNDAGKIDVANTQALRLFGYPKEELLGMQVEELVPQRLRERHVADRHGFFASPKVRQMGTGLELYARTKTGDEIPVEIAFSPITTARGTVVCAAIRDIAERKRSDEALRSAKTLAESALSIKARFLATASHDLRQPLQSLNLLNAALLKTVDEPKAHQMLSMQSESLGRMSSLLDSLLDITKLESGTVVVMKKDIAVQSLFQSMRATFDARAREKGLELRFEPSTAFVRSDPDLLAQLLQNLIANAIRYTKRGFVQVGCAVEGDRLRIAVVDSGVGIPSDQINHIFDEFHQVGRNPQERNAGLGLGLAIVRRAAALLGTNVEVESRVGHGSRFSLLLPAGKSTVAPVADHEIPRKSAANVSGQILLIDDDPAVLAATQLLLSMEPGFTVTTAVSPPEAYAVLEHFTPDLIITDLHLGHTESGIDIIRAARERQGRSIPAILATGDTGSGVQAIGIDDVQRMSKPMDATALIALARRLLDETGMVAPTGQR